jgi:hypothetical protein
MYCRVVSIHKIVTGSKAIPGGMYETRYVLKLFCKGLFFFSVIYYSISNVFFIYSIVRSLSVSFFIEKEPRKQLRMKRKRKGERKEKETPAVHVNILFT